MIEATGSKKHNDEERGAPPLVVRVLTLAQSDQIARMM